MQMHMHKHTFVSAAHIRLKALQHLPGQQEKGAAMSDSTNGWLVLATQVDPPTQDPLGMAEARTGVGLTFGQAWEALKGTLDIGPFDFEEVPTEKRRRLEQKVIEIATNMRYGEDGIKWQFGLHEADLTAMTGEVWADLLPEWGDDCEQVYSVVKDWTDWMWAQAAERDAPPPQSSRCREKAWGLHHRVPQRRCDTGQPQDKHPADSQACRGHDGLLGSKDRIRPVQCTTCPTWTPQSLAAMDTWHTHRWHHGQEAER
jgi:hypothetical protein